MTTFTTRYRRASGKGDVMRLNESKVRDILQRIESAAAILQVPAYYLADALARSHLWQEGERNEALARILTGKEPTA